MTDDDVENVARAICECRLWVGAWLKTNDVERDALMYEARSAIAALKSAGWRKIGPDGRVVSLSAECPACGRRHMLGGACPTSI